MDKSKDRPIFRNFERKDELLDYLRQNVDYYTYEELLELLEMHFGYTWSSITLLTGIMKKYGIKVPKRIALKTIHIESVYRFIPDIERMLNAKNLKREKDERYSDKIQEKLNRLKQMDEKRKENDSETK